GRLEVREGPAPTARINRVEAVEIARQRRLPGKHDARRAGGDGARQPEHQLLGRLVVAHAGGERFAPRLDARVDDGETDRVERDGARRRRQRDVDRLAPREGAMREIGGEGDGVARRDGLGRRRRGGDRRQREDDERAPHFGGDAVGGGAEECGAGSGERGSGERGSDERAGGSVASDGGGSGVNSSPSATVGSGGRGASRSATSASDDASSRRPATVRDSERSARSAFSNSARVFGGVVAPERFAKKATPSRRSASIVCITAACASASRSERE